MSVNDAASTWRGSGENHYNDGRGGKMEMMERGHAGSERMLHALDVCVCVCVADMKVKLYTGKICTE